MTDAIATVEQFYIALGQGDIPGALNLMADDISWTTMWHYKVNGRGPLKVVEGVFAPLTVEWSAFKLIPTEFIGDGGTIVSLGRFVATHATSGRKVDARYAHVWTVVNGKIRSFRQYIDTLAIASAVSVSDEIPVVALE